MHAQKGHTNQPEDEETNQGIRRNALRFRNPVVQRKERRPYRSNHDSDTVRAVHVLDCIPEDGKSGAGDDGDVGAPETP